MLWVHSKYVFFNFSYWKHKHRVSFCSLHPKNLEGLLMLKPTEVRGPRRPGTLVLLTLSLVHTEPPAIPQLYLSSHLCCLHPQVSAPSKLCFSVPL